LSRSLAREPLFISLYRLPNKLYNIFMKNILIIEDDKFLGDVLLERFNKEGFKTILSRDGREGLGLIKKLKPNLVLLDIILPTLNGYEILEAKTKDSEIKDIPVIIISNSGQPVELSRVLDLGVKDYFVKAQFSPDEVMAKVKDFMSDSPVSNLDTTTLQKSNKTTNHLTGKKIMWIEDDAFLGDIITRKLSAENAHLVYSKDAEDALPKVESEMPDVIVMDILLPGMSGFELLEKIKANPKTKNIPVVLLSNLSQQGDIEKGKSLGAELFLVKAAMKLDDIMFEIKKTLKPSHN